MTAAGMAPHPPWIAAPPGPRELPQFRVDRCGRLFSSGHSAVQATPPHRPAELIGWRPTHPSALPPGTATSRHRRGPKTPLARPRRHGPRPLRQFAGLVPAHALSCSSRMPVTKASSTSCVTDKADAARGTTGAVWATGSRDAEHARCTLFYRTRRPLRLGVSPFACRSGIRRYPQHH